MHLKEHRPVQQRRTARTAGLNRSRCPTCTRAHALAPAGQSRPPPPGSAPAASRSAGPCRPPSAPVRTPHDAPSARTRSRRRSSRGASECTAMHLFDRRKPAHAEIRLRRVPARSCPDRPPPPAQPDSLTAPARDTPADGCARTSPRPPPPPAASHRADRRNAHRRPSPATCRRRGRICLRFYPRTSNLEPRTSPHLLDRTLNRRAAAPHTAPATPPPGRPAWPKATRQIPPHRTFIPTCAVAATNFNKSSAMSSVRRAPLFPSIIPFPLIPTTPITKSDATAHPIPKQPREIC